MTQILIDSLILLIRTYPLLPRIRYLYLKINEPFGSNNGVHGEKIIHLMKTFKISVLAYFTLYFTHQEV